MHDYIIAVYFNDYYAGETVLKLEKVFCYGEQIPEKYMTYKYTIKTMKIVDILEA